MRHTFLKTVDRYFTISKIISIVLAECRQIQVLTNIIKVLLLVEINEYYQQRIRKK